MIVVRTAAEDRTHKKIKQFNRRKKKKSDLSVAIHRNTMTDQRNNKM